MIYVYITVFIIVSIIAFKFLDIFFSFFQLLRISPFDMFKGRFFFGLMCGAIAVWLLSNVLNGETAEQENLQNQSSEPTRYDAQN